MSARSWTAALAVALTAMVVATAAPAQEPRPAEVISFDREVRPILRKRCAGCHNPEKPRGELDLTSYSGLTAGGASGKAAVPGRPEESSLYTFAAHLEEPYMPPNAPKIPERELDVLRKWVEGGLLESPDAVPAEAGNRAKPASSAEPAAGLIPPETMPRAQAVAALAASPTRPIAAVPGRKQILILDLANRKVEGALAFPEGDLFALRFSIDGRWLLAAGGTGAESGRAVVFRTEDWARAATLGDELDAVLAADLSSDGTRVVVGGPGRSVKILDSPGGQVLHTFRKSTDWIMAAGFSPDGLLTAAGDRFGGLFLWETRSGREFLGLRGHPKAVTALAFSGGGDRLITAGEDGSIRTWDLHAGKAAAHWEAHPGGVLSVALDPSGRIASVGRDRRLKVWAPGGEAEADLGPAPDQMSRVAWAADARSLITGGLDGEVRVWNLADSSSIPIPLPVASKPPALALVVPDLQPARTRPRRAAPTIAEGTPAPVPDALDAALASAREAAASADRVVAELDRLRTQPGQGAPQVDKPVDALTAASAALTSLRSALAIAPESTDLRRAVEETERAVHALGREKSRPPGGPTAAATGR